MAGNTALAHAVEWAASSPCGPAGLQRFNLHPKGDAAAAEYDHEQAVARTLALLERPTLGVYVYA